MIKSMEELQAYLKTLPPVKEGHIRVYRGQTGRYPTINATLHRKNTIPGRDLWNSYCFILAKYLARLESIRYNRELEGLDDLNIFVFWVKALSQHYGPGTEYLDVTHSLPVALWFAFNEIEKHTLQSYAGKHGEAITKDDVINIIEANLYKPSNKNGWLYVFDAKISDGLIGGSHGDIVDVIASAPSVFRKSARLHAQKACLIMCDDKVKNGDCTDFLVCEPIEIEAGAAALLINDIHTAEIFPSPDYDEWYKRFIQVPYTYYGYTQEGNLAAYKSIPVDHYIDKNEQTPYVNSVTNKIITITPLSMYLYCLENEDNYADALKEATPVIIAAPLLATSDTVNKWNEEVLWGNAGLKGLKTPPKNLPKGLTTNLFFEFSPLEVPDWESIDTGGKSEWIRSIWVAAFGRKILNVQISVQSFPDEGEGLYSYRFFVWYDTENRALVYRKTNGDTGILADLEYYAKPIYVVLAIMGDCLDGVKFKPFPSVVIDGEKGIVIASDKSAVMLPSSEIPGCSQKYHRIFNIETNEPYYSVAQYLNDHMGISVEGINDYPHFAKKELDEVLDGLIKQKEAEKV